MIRQRAKPGPSPAEDVLLALCDQFYAVLETRGEQAARNFVQSLLANRSSAMRHVYIPDRSRPQPMMPKGGLVPQLKQEADAAQAALDPLLAQLREYGEQRRPMRARLAELNDPESLDEMSEAAELEIRLKMIERKMAKINDEIEAGPGRERAMTYRIHVMAESTAATLEREVADDAARLAAKLANLHFHTGKSEHTVLTIEVAK